MVSAQTLSTSVERAMPPVGRGPASPVRELPHVVAVLRDVRPVLDEPVADGLRGGGRWVASFGRHSITPLTRWNRSTSFSTHMLNGVLVVPLLVAAHVEVRRLGRR